MTASASGGSRADRLRALREQAETYTAHYHSESSACQDCWCVAEERLLSLGFLGGDAPALDAYLALLEAAESPKGTRGHEDWCGCYGCWDRRNARQERIDRALAAHDALWGEEA